MKHAEFQSWMEQAKQLTRSQRREALERLSEASSERLKYPKSGSTDEALAHVLEETGACPACGAGGAYLWGRRQGLQRFRCRACQHTFNALSGTPLAGLRKKERWLPYAHCLERGRTLRESAQACDVDLKTAFRWRHRFMERISDDQAEDLGGLVEADETFFRESQKGKRHLPRPSRKRGAPASQRGRSKEWIHAVTFRDRSGATHELVLRVFKASELVSELAFQLRRDAVLCTDGSPVYTKLAKALSLDHHAVKASAGERTRGAFHIQNVNAYHSRLKAWIARFHGVGTHYLPHYLGWHRLLDGHHSALTPSKLIRVALGKDRFQPTTPT